MIIYKITNKINNKEYIGRTIQSIHDRKRGYKKEIYVAERGIRSARPIIEAMIEHGFNNFKFEIIDKAHTEEELDRLEHVYIEKYKTLTTQGGYNDLRGNIDRRVSERTREKLKEIARNRENWEHLPRGEEHSTSTPVIELTTGKTFPSTLCADRFFGINGSRDTTVGQSGSIRGKVFRKIEDGSIVTKGTLPVKSGVYDDILPEYRGYAKKANNKERVEIIDLTTGIVYPSVRNASKELSLSAGNISRNTNGSIGSVNGRVFRKIVDGKVETGNKFKVPTKKVLNTVLDEYRGVISR